MIKMGRKKKFLSVAKSVKIKCPHCGKNTLIEMPKECIYFLDCKKCKNKIETPKMKCCIVCSYSNTACVPNLLREASRKSLEVRYLQ
jgi:peptide subunit release factor 1 (eRF1)